MRRLICAAVAAAFAFGAVPALAQDLAAAAAREKERRKASKGKSYSESDLGKSGAGTFSASAGSTSSQPATAAGGGAPATTSAATGAQSEKTPDDLRAEQQKAWRERLQKANDDIAKTQERVDTLQRALNDLSQSLYGSTRSQQLQQMEEAQKTLGSLRQQVSDLQEEGRRNGWR